MGNAKYVNIIIKVTSVPIIGQTTTLWRALRLWVVQLPYQAVIQPDRIHL